MRTMTNKRTTNENRFMFAAPQGLLDRYGQRKYLTQTERAEFLYAISALPIAKRLYCATLIYTGCRPSEASLLKPEFFDPGEAVVVIPCLKKRRPNIYRIVPVPKGYLHQMITFAENKHYGTANKSFFSWQRCKAYRIVKAVLVGLGHTGPRASPKALRHTYGINAILGGAPLDKLQKWMGHEDISTTSIYTDVIGPEERRLAEGTWANDPPEWRCKDQQ